MKKLSVFLLSILLFLGISASAQASIIFNDWTLDLTGIEGQAGQINNINQILFGGVSWVQTDDTNTNGTPDIGEVGSTQGLLTSLSYSQTGGGTALWGLPLEMTFDFSFNSIGVNPATGRSFSHLAAGDDVTAYGANASIQTDGLLELYVDQTPDSNQITGDGYTDGTHIATFAIKAGDGGLFSPITKSGSDDGTYELIWALDNVILDSGGNDLEDTIGLANAATIAVTDTNFDGDDDDNGVYDSSYGTNAWPAVGAQSDVNFLSTQNGSASLGTQTSVVPEPSAMILLGFGLLGLTAIGRKRLK